MRDNESNTMRDAPVNSQPPQASASTNSAIRAELSIADEESQETEAMSSAAALEVSSPVSEIALSSSNSASGHQTTYADRPSFEAPRRANRMLQIWTQCQSCSLWFAAPKKEVTRGRRRFCSNACTGKHAAASGRFKGERNPRWLGGVSNDNMRYRRRQAERDPIKERARDLVYNAVRGGELIRRPCEVCGVAKSEAHHDDYSKPLDVRWLCRRHHVEHHKLASGHAA